jgi:hypothetical protein
MDRVVSFLPVLSVLFLIGCGSSSTPPPCTNCPPVAKPVFLYASGGNHVLAFTVNTTTGELTGPMTVSGPNTSLGIAVTMGPMLWTRFP